jgi:mannitol-1-phosphate 5-dehydrogenase
MDKKLVLFGAGKIGRAFIGQLFSRGGFEVVFIDINRELIDNLNRYGEYKVMHKSRDTAETILVTNIRGICLDDCKKVSEELSDASLAAISVGQQGMEATLPAIREGLILRLQRFGNWPLDFILAENMRNADLFLMTKLKDLLPGDFPADTMIGPVETSIGKMVPIMSEKDLEEDPLQVFAEPYNSLIVSGKGFRNPVPQIAGLVPQEKGMG